MLLLTRETDPYSSMLTEPELPQECNRYVPLSLTHTHTHTQTHTLAHSRTDDKDGAGQRQGGEGAGRIGV